MPRSVASDLGLHFLPMSQSRFHRYRLYTALWHHSDKNSVVINNVSVTRIANKRAVNDNHVNNNFEILVYAYFNSIVSNQPKMLQKNLLPVVTNPKCFPKNCFI